MEEEVVPKGRQIPISRLAGKILHEIKRVNTSCCTEQVKHAALIVHILIGGVHVQYTLHTAHV